MSYYLLDNPPAIQQFHRSRANRLTGGVLVHTTESIMDSVGPDTGAENVAAFIARRRDYGSYHVIVDSDSIVDLLPDGYTAFHCAANGYNSRTWGISFACRTVDLNPDAVWTKKAVANAAMAITAFWKRNGIDPAAAARFIPAIETQSRPGLTTHGDAQPWDRSDAWTRHPRRGELERLLIDGIRFFAGAAAPPPPPPQPIPPIPTPPGVDLTVNKPVMMGDTRGKIWLFYANSPWRMHVKTPEHVNIYRFFGIEYKDVDRKTADFFMANTKAVRGG